MGVTEKGFAMMARMLLRLAEQYAGKRIAFLLEGGYDLAALHNSVAAVLEAMQLGQNVHSESPQLASDKLEPLLRSIRQVREKYS
jgi:acetoin utilization deacetylase AcuC-like enzyme